MASETPFKLLGEYSHDSLWGQNLNQAVLILNYSNKLYIKFLKSFFSINSNIEYLDFEMFSIWAILNYRLTKLHIKSLAKFSYVILLKKQIKLTFSSESN
jgi:hypothetical protein